MANIKKYRDIHEMDHMYLKINYQEGETYNIY